MEQERIYSTFFKRIFAFIIDLIPIGVISLIILFVAKDFFSTHQNLGVTFFWALAILYYGISNSKYFNGQSFGKSYFKYQVTDCNGNTLEFSKSFLRAFIFTAPLFINDYTFSKNDSNILLEITKFISGIVWFINVLFFVINSKTRESLHDYISNSFVVDYYRDSKINIESNISKKNLNIVLVVCSISTALSIGYYFQNKNQFIELDRVSDKIEQINDIESYSLSKSLYDSDNSKNLPQYNITLHISNKYSLDSNVKKITPLYNVFEVLARDEKVGANDSTVIVLSISQGYQFGLIKNTRSIEQISNIQELKKITNN